MRQQLSSYKDTSNQEIASLRQELSKIRTKRVSLQQLLVATTFATFHSVSFIGLICFGFPFISVFITFSKGNNHK